MNNNKIIKLYTDMAMHHQQFIQDMLGIAYTSGNEDMRVKIQVHMANLRLLMDGKEPHDCKAESQDNTTEMPKRLPRHNGLDHTDLEQDRDWMASANVIPVN